MSLFELDWGDPLTSAMEEVKNTVFRYCLIDAVDTNNATMNVKTYLGKQVKPEIPINFGSFGSYGGIRVMPKIGDIVLLGFNPSGEVVHLGASEFGYASFVDKALNTGTEFGKMQHVEQGEFHIQAVKVGGFNSRPIPQGSIYADRNGNIEIRSGTGEKIALTTGNKEMYQEVETLRYKNHKIRLSQGVVKREQIQIDGSTELTPRTYFGIPVVDTTTPQLSESRLKVGQDINLLTGEDSGDPTVELNISEQILDDDAIPEFDSSLTDLNLLLRFDSGLDISVNNDGVMNIGKGEMLLPPKKNAARENDEVETAIGFSHVDTTHPGQAAKAAANISEMASLARMFYTMGSPAQFIPSGDVSLKGEIIEGSETLFVGD